MLDVGSNSQRSLNPPLPCFLSQTVTKQCQNDAVLYASQSMHFFELNMVFFLLKKPYTILPFILAMCKSFHFQVIWRAGRGGNGGRRRENQFNIVVKGTTETRILTPLWVQSQPADLGPVFLF